VVGVLEVGSGQNWVIRTRDGDAVTVDPASVVAAKVVPDAQVRLRTASDIDIASLELIAADGWQPLEREELGDWLLRAAHGFTGRANSVLPIGEPGIPLDLALETVQSWYAARSLPAMFQMPLPLHADLNAELTARGWDHFHPTHVMVCDLDPLRMAAHSAAEPTDTVSLTTAEAPDEDWMSAFRYRGMRLQQDVTPILTLNDHPVFITARDTDRSTRAIGRGAVTDRWLGITAVEVGESFRRQGLGRRIIAALADYAAAHGARYAYLQVAEDNEPAIALYERLGFRRHHDYVYRRWVAG
jgi:GNAT superfamily N-acetyltransferase